MNGALSPAGQAGVPREERAPPRRVICDGATAGARQVAARAGRGRGDGVWKICQWI
jgi:hypothetical protein